MSTPSGRDSAPTVRAVLDLYLRHSRATGLHCAAALAERERTFNQFIAAHGNLPVAEARPYHLSDWIESHQGWRSISTRRAKCNQIRAAFAWAARQERIERNPFHTVRYAEAERRPAMPDEITRTICLVANKPFACAVRFLRLTGARLSELCQARWTDLDLDAGVWIIPRHKSLRFTGKPKVVALVPEAVALLRELRAMADASAVTVAAQDMPSVPTVEARTKDAGFVFTNTRGRPWTRRTLGQQLRRLKARFGIASKASLHGLRHALATTALGNGAPILLVAEQLGHASTIITQRYYWHPGREHLQAMRDAALKGLPR